MALVPIIFIVGLLAFTWIAGVSSFGVLPALVATVLLVGVGVGLLVNLGVVGRARA